MPEEKVQYFIEIEAPEDGCEATDLKAATLNSSRSNRKGKLKISTGTGYVVDPGLLNIYPNPSDGIFTISMELERMDNVELNVFDITGKIIIRKQFDNVPFRLDSQIDLTGYEDGIYQVHLKTGNILLQRILIKD